MSRLIAVWSPGGAGATTLVLTLGVAAAQAGLAPLLADLNLGQPDLALRLGLLREDDPLAACLAGLLPDLVGRRLKPETLARYLRTVADLPGLTVLPGVLRPLDGSRLTEEHLQQILAHLRRTSALLLADTAPALDSLGTFVALQQADAIYAVVSDSPSSRFHLARHLALLPDLGIPLAKLHLVSCGKQNPAALCDELGLTPLACLPAGLDPRSPPAVIKTLLAHAQGGEANARG